MNRAAITGLLGSAAHTARQAASRSAGRPRREIRVRPAKVAEVSFLGDQLRGRDIAVGIILSLSLGLGVLFLHLYTTYATQATSLLFGNVLGVSSENLWDMLVLGVLTLVFLKSGIALSVIFAAAETWAGIALAYVTDWPPSFWITLLSSVVYGLTFVPRLSRLVPRSA